MTFSDVKVAVTAPSGWQVAATTAASQASLAPGASFTTKWQVAAPASLSSAGTGNITAAATFTLDSAPVSQSAVVPVSIAAALSQAFNNTGISDNSDTAAANFDGAGNSFSAQGKTVTAVTLPTGGSAPSGGRVTGMHIFALGVG